MSEALAPSSRRPIAGVPIKPFGSAKKRLTGAIDDNQRRALARFLAANTLSSLKASGVENVVLAADGEVAAFAADAGCPVLAGPDSNLNESATQLQEYAASKQRPWLIVHADLPYLTVDALETPLRLLEQGLAVITPSPDGGTPLVGQADHQLVFRYGPASFQRHLVQMPTARVILDPRLGCDIDRPRDLEVAIRRIEGISTLLGS